MLPAVLLTLLEFFWGHRESSWGALGDFGGRLVLLGPPGGVSWKPPGGLLGASWGLLGPLGDLLGTSWCFLGRFWSLIGRSWGGLGTSWGGLEAS